MSKEKVFINGEWVEREARKVEIKANDIPIRGHRANIIIEDLWQMSEDDLEIIKSFITGYNDTKEDIETNQIYLSSAGLPHQNI